MECKFYYKGIAAEAVQRNQYHEALFHLRPIQYPIIISFLPNVPS